MHIAISWDISSSGEQWKLIDEKLRAVLKPYSWIRPLNTFYVVRVDGEGVRAHIDGQLTAIAKSAPVTVHILVSPVMPGGSNYLGYLPTATWPEVNQRTS